MKKALRETQTLRAGCSRSRQKNRPAADPPSRGTWRSISYSGDGHYLHLQT